MYMFKARHGLPEKPGTSTIAESIRAHRRWWSGIVLVGFGCAGPSSPGLLAEGQEDLGSAATSSASLNKCHVYHLPLAVRSAYLGSGQPGGPFSSQIYLRNAGEVPGTCDALFTSDAGASYGDSISLDASGLVDSTKLYDGAALPSGLQGWVTFHCDQPTGIVERVFSHDGQREDDIAATTVMSNVGYAPLVYRENWGYRSSLRVANHELTANTIQVDYYQGSTRVGTTSHVIAGGRAIWINQADVPFLNPTRGVYSARLSGTGQFIATVVQHGRATTKVEKRVMIYPLVAPPTSQVAYHPFIARNLYGYYTGQQVQNVSQAPTSMLASYFDQSGTSLGNVQSPVVQPYASVTFDDTSSTFLGPSVYGATVRSSGGGPVASVVNLIQNVKGRASSYVGQQRGARSFVEPRVHKDADGYTTGFTCVNTSGRGTYVTIALAPSIEPSTSWYKGEWFTRWIPAGASFAWNTGDAATIPLNYRGSALVGADEPIACITNTDIVSGPRKDADLDLASMHATIPLE